MLLVFLTVWANISPAILPTAPDPQFGYFDNAAYLGPTTGGLSNFLILSLFTFAFGVVSGAHLNPTITCATFLVRLSSLPRAVLYVCFQLLGASLGGLLVRAGYGSRDFKTGGCWLFPDVVPVQSALAIEFAACTSLLFCAFGVGLDPRQRSVIPPSLAPFLVGLTLGTISWMTGYSRFGYGGASMNPARCFGTFVGSSFPIWHWHHWSVDNHYIQANQNSQDSGSRTYVPVCFTLSSTISPRRGDQREMNAPSNNAHSFETQRCSKDISKVPYGNIT